MKIQTVPGMEEMDDETAYKHLNARHKADLGLTSDMHYSPTISDGLVAAQRAFHRRIHEIAVPIDRFNHEHVGEN